MKKKMTSSAANAFGAGEFLVGMKHRGKVIISATRKFMVLDNGDKVERKGNRVEHEETLGPVDNDNNAYMTDDI